VIGIAQKVLATGGLPLLVPPSQYEAAVEVADKMWNHEVDFDAHSCPSILNEKTLGHTRNVVFQDTELLKPKDSLHFVSVTNLKKQVLGWASAPRRGFLSSDAHGQLASGRKGGTNGDCPLCWDGVHGDKLWELL